MICLMPSMPRNATTDLRLLKKGMRRIKRVVRNFQHAHRQLWVIAGDFFYLFKFYIGVTQHLHKFMGRRLQRRHLLELFKDSLNMTFALDTVLSLMHFFKALNCISMATWLSSRATTSNRPVAARSAIV